jgi:putative aldouronate transport system substrate-binding protein
MIPVKKSVAIILTSALSISLLLTGCNDQSEAKSASASKEVRILTNVVGGKDPEEQKLFVKEIEKETGLKIKMEKPPADYDQKLLTAMSSGEKYDLVYLTKPLLDILVKQGALTDLTDKIKKSKELSDPTVIPPEEWELIRSEDGKLYAVPNKFEGGTLPIVRQDWMKKLGLQQPKTLDDFYNVFKAFKEKNPNGDGKPVYGLSTAGLNDIQPFMSAVGVKYKYVIDKNGKRTIPYATEKAVPVYEWLHKLYKEGLLDPNFATNDTRKMRELFLSDRVGMVTYWDVWVGLFNNIRKTKDPNTSFEARGIPGAVGPDGKIMLRRGDPSLWAIPANAENPEGAMKFLEFWHSEKGNLLGSLGIEGHDYIVKNGKYELTAIGKEHGMDHGAPIPNNTKFKNPIGYLPGVKEAQKIIQDNNATVEIATADWPEAEKIVTKYAFKAIMGELPAKEAVQKMHDELLKAKLIDY